jgi:CheY-like chemotaxis protein
MRDEVPRTTVSVVEDETLDRMYGADILEGTGFEVLEASNADEALLMFGLHDDVQPLFCDIATPGSMDGIELARIVHERWPYIRLLLTSKHHQLYEAALPDDGRFVRNLPGPGALKRVVAATIASIPCPGG